MGTQRENEINRRGKKKKHKTGKVDEKSVKTKIRETPGWDFSFSLDG